MNIKKIKDLLIYCTRIDKICLKLIDRCRGLDFMKIVSTQELGLDPNTSYRYSPTDKKYLKKIFNTLNINQQDSIIDIGCGKGSALRTILKFPFARIDGLDISPQLTQIAQNNFAKLHASRTTIYTTDATKFDHYHRYNYFYFYNPFSPDIMAQVIKKIERSLKLNHRTITIIYTNPQAHTQIEKSGAFTKSGEFVGQWNLPVYIYHNS